MKRTRHLHSSGPSDHDFNTSDNSDDSDPTTPSDTDEVAQQSTLGASSLRENTKADMTRSGPSASISYLPGASLLNRQNLEGDIDDDAANNGPPTSQGLGSRKTKRMIPDRSAKPLGDQDVRRRRAPDRLSSQRDDSISTSVGESAPTVHSTKRPLPDSPSSQLQMENAVRRRQFEREISNREESDSP